MEQAVSDSSARVRITLQPTYSGGLEQVPQDSGLVEKGEWRGLREGVDTHDVQLHAGVGITEDAPHYTATLDNGEVASGRPSDSCFLAVQTYPFLVSLQGTLIRCGSTVRLGRTCDLSVYIVTTRVGLLPLDSIPFRPLRGLQLDVSRVV